MGSGVDSSSALSFTALSRRSIRSVLGVCGLASGVFVSIGGRIAAGEIALCIIAATVLLAVLWRARGARHLTLATIVLAIGIALGTLANHASPQVVMTTTTNYLVLLICALAIGFLLGAAWDRTTILITIGCTAIGQIAGVFLTPTATALIDPWKFGIGSASTLLALIVIEKSDRIPTGRVLAPFAVLALAMLNFVLGSRSIAILVLLAGFVASRWGKSLVERRGAGFWLLVLIGSGLTIALVMYDYAASTGLLGPNAAAKYDDQSGDLGILFGARKEIVVLLGAWLASPFFGWGAGAEVPFDVRSRAYVWFSENGYTLNHSAYMNLFGSVDVPLHSVALGALIQAGVFSVLFIVIAARLLWEGLRGTAMIRSRPAAFVVLTAGAHFLVSPLGDITRFPLALGLGIGIAAMLNRNEPPKSSSVDEARQFNAPSRGRAIVDAS